MDGMIYVTPDIGIDEKEIEEHFIRASGPGGQHVNKVATAVQLRFNVRNSPSLPPDVRDRLAHFAGKRMTESGVLIIEARSYRSQERNRQDAINRLVALVRRASRRPKIRRKTKPTAVSRERRLRNKHQRGEIKRTRKEVLE